MINKIISIGEKSLNSISENIGSGIEKGKELSKNISQNSIEIYETASQIPLDKKEQILEFVYNNKELIVEKLLEETKDTEIDDFALRVIHGMFPFPLGFIIKEETFVAFGKKNIGEISNIIKPILFDKNPTNDKNNPNLS